MTRVTVTDGEHVWSYDPDDFAAQLRAAFAATDGSPEAVFDVAWDAMAHVSFATPPDRAPEPLSASLELLAAALCHDAQVEGYDHGAQPTLVSFAPAYCPRHLGIAQNVRWSLSRNFVGPDDAPVGDGRTRPEAADVLRVHARVHRGRA